KALGAVAVAYQHILTRTQLSDAEAAKRFHVDENVRRALAGRQEAETANAVKPFYLKANHAGGWLHHDMSAGSRHLGGMTRRRFVHRHDAECLQATGAIERLDDNTGTFISGLVAVPAQASHMQQHIGLAIVRDDKAEPLAGVEPFDSAGNLDGIET